MHFFRNHRYRKRNTNQSKVHWGHESAALGILGLLSPSVKVLFPVWVQLLAPGGAHSVQSSSPLPLLYGLYHRPDLGCLHPRALLKWRWGLEPAFRDNKENLGFDHYQVHAQPASNAVSCSPSSLPVSLAWSLYPPFKKPTDRRYLRWGRPWKR